MTNKAKWLLKCSFIGSFAEAMLLPVWAVLTNRVGGSILDAGIGFSIFEIVTGIMVVGVGRTKWFNRNLRSMVFWGFLLAGIGDVLYIFAHNIYQLFVVQCVIGISVGLMNPAWDGLYSQETEEGDEGEAWSFWNGGVSFFVGTAALIGGLIVNRFGFVPLFICMGIADIPATVYAYKVWKDDK